MVIAKRRVTESDRRRIVVDYCKWLCAGVWLTDALVTSGSTSSTVDTVSVIEGRQVVFFVNAGSTGETFSVTVKVTTSQGVTKTDTITFVVVAP